MDNDNSATRREEKIVAHRNNDEETSGDRRASFAHLPEELQEIVILYDHKRGAIDTDELLRRAKTCRLWKRLIHEYLSRTHPVHDYLLNDRTKISRTLNISHEFVDRLNLVNLERRLTKKRVSNNNNDDRNEYCELESIRCFVNEYLSSWTIRAKDHHEVWRCSWTPYGHRNFVHCNYLMNNETLYYHNYLTLFTSDYKRLRYCYTVDILFVDRIVDMAIVRHTRPRLEIVVWLNEHPKVTVLNEFVKISLYSSKRRTHEIDVCKRHLERGFVVVGIDDYPNDLTEIQLANRYRVNPAEQDEFLASSNRQRYNNFANMRAYVHFKKRKDLKRTVSNI